jgi:nitrous oxidase accessory protein NosD
MRRLLGLVAAALAASLLLALNVGQALATTAHCGDVITQDTTLDSDLACSSEPALTLAADNVTLDLAGHTIRMEGETPRTAITDDPDAGVPCCGLENLTIENGVLDRGGVHMLYPVRPTVRHLTLTGGGGIGLTASRDAMIYDNEVVGTDNPDENQPGIGVTAGTAAIRHNIVRNGFGIQFGLGGTASVTDNLITGSLFGVYASTRTYERAEIARNRILGNTYMGISFDRSYGDVHDNVISGNGAGVGLYVSSADLQGNVITDNQDDGITVGDDVSLDARDNVISRNGGNGVLVNSPRSESGATARLIGNRILANALDGVHIGRFTSTQSVEGNRTDRNGDDGIETENPDATLTRNRSWFNHDLGIEAVPGTLGGGNWAKHNGNPLQCVPTTLCSTTGKPKG